MVFTQLLKFVPRHGFESLANQHHSGRKLRKMTRWAQFVCIATAQLSDHSSLLRCCQQCDRPNPKVLPLGHQFCQQILFVQGQRIPTLPTVRSPVHSLPILTRRGTTSSPKTNSTLWMVVVNHRCSFYPAKLCFSTLHQTKIIENRPERPKSDSLLVNFSDVAVKREPIKPAPPVTRMRLRLS